MSNTPPIRDADETASPFTNGNASPVDDSGDTAGVDDVATHHEPAPLVEPPHEQTQYQAPAAVPIVTHGDALADAQGTGSSARSASGIEPRSGANSTPEARGTTVSSDDSRASGSREHAQAPAAVPAAVPAVTRPTSESSESGETKQATEPATEPATQSSPAPRPVQTVYVTAPVPPKKRGNRIFGLLLAVVAVVVFALIFAGVMALILNLLFPGEVVERLVIFLASSAFLVPVIVFVVAFVLLILIANRASWWAYVLGGFIVALVVYFATIGVIMLGANVFGMTRDEAMAGFIQLASSPSIIVAALVARELTLWFGAAIASRGRKVRARNAEAKAQFERENNDNRTEHARA